jgi:hypothetical protein
LKGHRRESHQVILIFPSNTSFRHGTKSLSQSRKSSGVDHSNREKRKRKRKFELRKVQSVLISFFFFLVYLELCEKEDIIQNMLV